MPSSSQYVATKTSLVSLLNAAITANGATLSAAGIVGAEAFYSWQGADIPPDGIFLGRHPALVANPLLAAGEITSEDPVMKAGRRQRQQDFDIEVTCWTFRNDLTADGAQEAETGGQALFDVVDGVVADRPTPGVVLGLSTLKNAEISSCGVGLVPFQRGWASVFVPIIHVETRLT